MTPFLQLEGSILHKTLLYHTWNMHEQKTTVEVPPTATKYNPDMSGLIYQRGLRKAAHSNVQKSKRGPHRDL